VRETLSGRDLMLHHEPAALRTPLGASLLRCALILFALVCTAVPSPGHAETLVFEDNKLTVPLTRLLVSAGTEVEVFYDSCKVGEVTFVEESRDLKIVSQFREIIKQVGGKAPGATCNSPQIDSAKYVLKYKRATLKVKVIRIDTEGSEEVDVVTGPAEHWYLGIDLPVTNSKSLKYDSGTQSLLPKAEGQRLYLSLNYTFADDLFKEAPEDYFTTKRLSAKALITASSKPLDSVGLALVPQFDTSTKKSWRIGVAYNLSDGLGWVTKK
jgi:hypothetical protein